MSDQARRGGWRRLAWSRWGLVALLVGLGFLDYGAAKGLRALHDRAARVMPERPEAPSAGLSPASPMTLAVPGTAVVDSGPASVAVPAGVSVFIAPSLIDQIDLAGKDGPTPVDPFGLPDSAGSGLPVPQANRGALIARLDAEAAFAIGSRSCIFTTPRGGHLSFGVNDRDPSRNGGAFRVTISVPEIRSVLAATPACGTVLE